MKLNLKLTGFISMVCIDRKAIVCIYELDCRSIRCETQTAKKPKKTHTSRESWSRARQAKKKFKLGPADPRVGIIDFVAEIENKTTQEAINRISDWFGLDFHPKE